jgi:hypothetical protein
MDALRVFPDNAETIETAQGLAHLQKRDIFKNLMWYSYRSSNKQYPLSITRVKEIIKANKEGIKPDELQPVELETSANKAGLKVDVGFVNDVGQITLKALEKSNRKKRSSSSGKPQQSAQGAQPKQGRPQGSRPPQSAQKVQPGQKPQTQKPSQRPNQPQPKPAQPNQRQSQSQGQNQRPKPRPNSQRNNNRDQQPNKPAV